METIHDLTAVVFAAIFLKVTLGVFVYRQYNYWKQQGELYASPAYLSPPPGRIARYVRYNLCRLFVFAKVGHLTVVGKEKIDSNARYIIVGNHQIQHDAMLLPTVLKLLNYRALMSIDELTGYRAPLGAYAGMLAVHPTGHKGASVLLALKALKNEPDSSLIIFPQGRLIKDNVLRREDFRPGAAVISTRANKESVKPLAILPIGIEYLRQPESLQHLPWYVRMFFLNGRQWFGQTTYGAIVVVGEPILLKTLSQEPDQITQLIFESVQEQCNRAVQLSSVKTIAEN